MLFPVLQMSVMQILKQFENIEHVDVLPTRVVIVTDDQKYVIEPSRVSWIRLDPVPKQADFAEDDLEGFLQALTDWRDALKAVAALLEIASQPEQMDVGLKAQAEREKQSLKDLAAVGLLDRSKSARAERLSEQAAAMVGMAPEDMDACNDVNNKTVERLRDFTEKLEAGNVSNNRRPSNEEFFQGALRLMDDHARYLEATARGRQIKEEITRIFQVVSDALGLPAELLTQSEESSWSASQEWFKAQQEAEPRKAEGIDAEFESPVKDYVSVEEIYARLVDRYRSWEFTQDGKIFSFDVDLDSEEGQVRLVNYQDGHYCWMVILHPMPAGKVNAVCVSGMDDIKNAFGLSAEHIEEERLGERVIDVDAIFNGEDWWTNGPYRKINFATTWAFSTGEDHERHWWLHGAGEKTACGKVLDIYEHPSAPIREQPTACACTDCRKAWDRLIGEGSQADDEK